MPFQQSRGSWWHYHRSYFSRQRSFSFRVNGSYEGDAETKCVEKESELLGYPLDRVT